MYVDPATLALAKLIDSTHCMTWSAKSESSSVPVSALWHRANVRPSKEEKAANQRYLTTRKKTLLRMTFYENANRSLPESEKTKKKICSDRQIGRCRFSIGDILRDAKIERNVRVRYGKSWSGSLLHNCLELACSVSEEDKTLHVEISWELLCRYTG